MSQYFSGIVGELHAGVGDKDEDQNKLNVLTIFSYLIKLKDWKQNTFKQIPVVRIVTTSLVDAFAYNESPIRNVTCDVNVDKDRTLTVDMFNALIEQPYSEFLGPQSAATYGKDKDSKQ